MQKEVERRRTFSYSVRRFCALNYLDYKCCMCCRVRKKRADFLFREARQKLVEELDILEIIKKLRVFQFASNLTLQPHQKDLVNFFQEYKLGKTAPSAAFAEEQRASYMPLDNMDDALRGQADSLPAHAVRPD